MKSEPYPGIFKDNNQQHNSIDEYNELLSSQPDYVIALVSLRAGITFFF